MNTTLLIQFTDILKHLIRKKGSEINAVQVFIQLPPTRCFTDFMQPSLSPSLCFFSFLSLVSVSSLNPTLSLFFFPYPFQSPHSILNILILLFPINFTPPKSSSFVYITLLPFTISIQDFISHPFSFVLHALQHNAEITILSQICFFHNR